MKFSELMLTILVGVVLIAAFVALHMMGLF
jgi:hypothetical protein